MRRVWIVVAALIQVFASKYATAQPLAGSARSRLSQLDGTITVAGLDTSVEVRRDRWGVPHIYAHTQHDLFFAQGYIAAQDRLWQMEMWRRAGEGRLAEVLGSAVVERDRFARLLKYRGDMDAEWASYADDTRAIVQAFVQGVNARIDDVRSRPPIEFEMLGIKPEPWTDDVPLQRMAALAMTGNATSEVLFALLVNLVGLRKAEAMLPTDPYRPLDPAPDVDLSGINISSLGAAAGASGAIPYQRIEGSNNWVVSGTKTATGKPLLANDPHRAITVPSLRYLVHLVAPGWNVIGAGEPALPGVAGGHNERVGFGFTIVGMDQQDVYVETIGPCPDQSGRRCYLYGGNWKPLRTMEDTIGVKGEPSRVVSLEFTEHGPIVSEDSARRRAFALRFVGSEPGTAGYLAQISLNRVSDWPSFLAAARRWKLPTENLVYGDVDGNIGWVAAGLMPVRSWSGLLPVSGTGGYEWDGFLDFSQLPRSFNPAPGIIVTANNNILPPGYEKPLSYEWASPYRARRITEVLSAGSKFTRADFEQLQHDEMSLPARHLVPVLLAAARTRGARESHELRSLRQWDFAMSRHSVAPLIYESWLQALGRRVFRARAGAAGSLLDSEWDLQTLVRLVTTPDSEFGTNPSAARDSIALIALADAVRTITKRLGADRAKWRWGALHRASFKHPLAEAFDLPSVERGGDANTVNATGGALFTQQYGASYRLIVDFADWDNSVVTSTPGQSGQPGSEFYGNLLPLWGDGRYIPLAFTRSRVELETKHVLTLVPAR